MMRAHRQNQRGVTHELARQRLRFVLTEVEPTFHSDEERTIRRGRAVPSTCPSAHDFDVRERSLHRHLASDGIGERTTTGVASANKEQAHALRVSHQTWYALT